MFWKLGISQIVLLEINNTHWASIDPRGKLGIFSRFHQTTILNPWYFQFYYCSACVCVCVCVCVCPSGSQQNILEIK